MRQGHLGAFVIATAFFWTVSAIGQPRLTPGRQPSAPAPAPSTSAPQASASALPEPGDVFRDCSDCSEMVVVPPGDFKMGSEDSIYEKPVHPVSIANPFAIGRREVTFDEWDLCVTDGGCNFRPSDYGWGRGNRPVMDVSWTDAKAFTAWLSRKTGKSYRLPTEAEWEYAARAGTETAFWWGRALVKGNANCEDCGDGPQRKTLPVQSFRPNGFGLFDVAGNVAEWVEDCWNDTYRGAPANGAAWTTGQCSQRGLRGGSFASRSTFVRSPARFRYDQDVRYYANGFRVARDLK